MNTEVIDANAAKSSTAEEAQLNPDVEAQSSSAEGEQAAAEQAHDEGAAASLQEIIANVAKDSRDTDVEVDATEESPPSKDQEPAEVIEADTGEGEPQGDEFEIDEVGFTAEELKALKAKTKDRFDELLAQRDEFKRSAEESAVITKFMAENNISSDEMAKMMGTMAFYQAGDYQNFLTNLQPMMERAGTALGSFLPDDIQKRVDDGYIDEASASEMASQRALATDNQERLKREQFNNQQIQQQAVVNDMRLAVDTWESDTKKVDIDYAKKEEQIRTNTRALMAQYGTPINAEQAVQLSKDAYAMVNNFTQQTAPPPREIKPGPSSATVPNAHAEPKSMLDAVKLGIRNAKL